MDGDDSGKEEKVVGLCSDGVIVSLDICTGHRSLIGD